MIIFHVFLKNNLLVTNPKARPRREYDWDHESMDPGTLGWHQALMLPAAAAKLLQLYLTQCDLMDSSPPGSSIHRIL